MRGYLRFSDNKIDDEVIVWPCDEIAVVFAVGPVLG